METIGFAILWFFAAMHVFSAVIQAFMVGKPKVETEWSASGMWISAGAAILFLYGMLLITVSR